MDISLPQLKAFIAVARQRSFTRAAAELGLTQSAISHRVGELEKEISQRLFDRTTRQVYLTDAGLFLSERICTLIEEVEETLRESKRAGAPTQGMIRIASDSVLSSMSVPNWLSTCNHIWPEITIHIKDCPADEVLERVRSGQVDFGLAIDPKPENDDDLYYELIYTDTYHAVMSVKHPLASQLDGRESIEWSDLRGIDILALYNQSGMQTALEKVLENSGHRIKDGSLQLFGHFCTIFGMAAVGLGIGIVPSRACKGMVDPRLIMRPLATNVTIDAMLVGRKRRLLRPAASVIWNALLSSSSQDTAAPTITTEEPVSAR